MDGPDPEAPDAWTFLVERYWPGIDEAGLQAALPRLDAAVNAITAEGRPVQHVGSFLMPRDQVVFSVIRAGSEQIVREANERAGLPVDRIAEATALGFAGPSPFPSSVPEEEEEVP